MTPPFIQFIDICKAFGALNVLDRVNLSIQRGEILAIIGKSGTGKSVLLKHLIGLVRQDAGELLIDGTPLDQMDRPLRNRFQKEISYMFQDNALFDFMTVYDNIALPLSETRRLSRADLARKVASQMQLLSLEGTEHKFPSQLSGGMRKRVALARALITDPKLILFDEPTTGLDPVRKKTVHQMIAHYQKKFGFTAVIVSHDIPDIFDICQRIAMLDTGKIIFEGTCEQILEAKTGPVHAFINGNESLPAKPAQDKGV